MSKQTTHYSNNLTPRSYQPQTQQKLPGTLTELKSFVDLFSNEAKKSKQKGDILKVKRSSDILKFVINKIDEIFRNGYSTKTLSESSSDFRNFLKASRADALDENSGHYYEMVTFFLQGKLKTVEFTNKQDYLKSPRERADIWILLEFNFHELDNAVEEICNIPDVKEMYRVNKGVLNSSYKELQEILKVFKEIEFVVDSEIIKGYETFAFLNSPENKLISKVKASAEVNSAGLKEKTTNLKKENSESSLLKLENKSQPDYIETLDPNDPIVIWNMKKNKMNEKNAQQHSSIFAREEQYKTQVAPKNLTKSAIIETNTKEAMKIINATNETLKADNKHNPKPKLPAEEPKESKIDKESKGKDVKETNNDSKDKKGKVSTDTNKEVQVTETVTPSKVTNVITSKGEDDYYQTFTTPDNNNVSHGHNDLFLDGETERESKLKVEDFITPSGDDKVNRLYDALRIDENKNTPRQNEMNFNSQSTEEKMKNSQRLYQDKYKIYEETLFFKEKPKDIGDQIYQCYSCHENISKGIYILWNNARYCYYSGYWYCSNCISFNKRPIPWKALEEFDLRSYRVCKEADREIECLYDKPILRIEYNSDIVVKNKTLYEFMVLKRQIHLVYDMICDMNLMHDLMQDKINVVLKQNLFSLKNLVDISNGSLTKYLEKCFSLLTRHIDDCKTCQSKGVVCKICNSNLKVFPFDLKNSSICKNCKRLYHTRCLQLQNCVVCIHNF